VLELIQPRKRHARRHASESFAHQHDVDAHIVLGDDVRKPPPVRVHPFAVALETHPAVQHKRRKLVARGKCKRRSRVEDPADLRRVDSEQPHTTECRDVDRVAVDDRANEDQL
jgi:hypothetical protein